MKKTKYFTGIPRPWSCDEIGEKHRLRVQKVLSFFFNDVTFACQKCPYRASYDRRALQIMLTTPVIRVENLPKTGG